MKNRFVVVAKEYGQDSWQTYSLPGGKTMTVMPREHFQRACAVADEKLKEAVADIRRVMQTALQKKKHEL